MSKTNYGRIGCRILIWVKKSKKKLKLISIWVNFFVGAKKNRFSAKRQFVVIFPLVKCEEQFQETTSLEQNYFT